MLDPVRPTDDQLRRFLAGTLPDAEAEAVGRWVESDPDAARALARLETPASLADALAAPATRADHTTPAGPPSAPDPAPTLPDGYRLLGVLGHGGMGVVYRAVDEEIDREVAVKVLTARIPAGSGAETRFHDEARITGQLQHPGIPPVYRVGRLPDGRPFLAMKLIKGDTLADLLEARTAVVDRLGVFEQVCQAVGYAHAHGVIHRDLKPHNVMLGTFGEVQVMDWGLAKVLAPLSPGGRGVGGEGEPNTPAAPRPTEIKSLRDSDTEAGSVLGTPAFMAPEQAIGAADQLDRRTDVFGLGAILSVLLTGHPPYVSADPEATRQLAARAKLKDCFARLNSCGAEPELIALCKRCLSGEPDDRPADAQALADSVRRLRAAADERARRAEIEREKATVQAGEQRKRQRVRLWAAAAVATALLVGLGLSVWQMARAIGAEGQATRNAADAERNAAEAKENAAAAERNAEQARTERDAKQLALKAEEEAKQVAVTVRDVMKNKLLRQANPFVSARWTFGQGKQPDLTVRAVLDQAAQELGPDRIDQAFPNQPLVQAEVLETIGETYEGIREYQTALRFLEAAYTVRLKHQGPTHTATLVARADLIFAYMGAARLLDATKTVNALAEQLEGFLAELPDSPERRVGHPALARVDAVLNRIIERASTQGFVYPVVDLGALEATRLALQVPQLVGRAERLAAATGRRFGPDDRRTLVTEMFHAFALHGVGQTRKACDLYEGILARAEKLPDLDALVLDGIRDVLVTTYQQLDIKLADRLRLLHLVHQSRAKALGPNHPSTLISMSKLADGYRDAGQSEKALALLEEAYKRMSATLSTEHPDTLGVMTALAEFYTATGRADRAVPLYEEVLRVARKRLGADSPDTLFVLNKLSVSHWTAGQPDKAVPLCEESLRLNEKRHGRGHQETQLAVANLGTCLKAVGRVTEAVPLLEEAYRASAKQPKLQWVGWELLDGYAKAGKKDEATKLLAEVMPAARKASPKDSPELAGALAVAGLSLLELGAFEEAEPLVRECLGIREKKEPQAWTTFNARVMVGWALLGQKKYADAEPLLVKGYDGLKEREKDIPKAGETRIPEALDRLVELYTATDKPDEAKKYQDLRAKYKR